MRPWYHYFCFLSPYSYCGCKKERNNKFVCAYDMITCITRLNRFFIQSLSTHIPTSSLVDCISVGSSSKMDVYPMITLIKFLNISPTNSLVKKSANIKCVGQYSAFISTFSILSFMKKYLICICLEFPVHGLRPFSPYASHFDCIDRSHCFISHNLVHS